MSNFAGYPDIKFCA